MVVFTSSAAAPAWLMMPPPAATAALPDKVLWLNFPSSVHLEPNDVVEQKTVDLLDEAGSMDGILMGVTEDMPPHRWQESCLAIMSGLERHAHDHAHLY